VTGDRLRICKGNDYRPLVSMSNGLDLPAVSYNRVLVWKLIKRSNISS